MISAPATPTKPRAVAIADFSGASTKDHKARNVHSKVLTVTKTRWKPLRDMTGDGWISERCRCLGILAVELGIMDRIVNGEGGETGKAAHHAKPGSEEPVNGLLF